tara:strand:- start:937 stop:1149 length:213 start_codon:yes stop_codon:yes gene_type:complete
MRFNFEDKYYNSEELSVKGQFYLKKVMAVKELSEKIDLESNDLKSLFTNYSDLLKKELPKKEKVDIKKGA